MLCPLQDRRLDASVDRLFDVLERGCHGGSDRRSHEICRTQFVAVRWPALGVSARQPIRRETRTWSPAHSLLKNRVVEYSAKTG